MKWAKVEHPAVILALLASAWALATSAGTYWVAGGLTIYLGVHLAMGWRWPMQPRLLWAVLLATPFALWMRYLTDHPLTGFTPIDLFMAAGCFLVTLGAFWITSIPQDKTAMRVTSLAVVGAALAGAAPMNQGYLPLALATAVLAMWQIRHSLFAGDSWKYKWPVYLATVLLLLGLSGSLHYLSLTMLPRINRALSARMIPLDRDGMGGEFRRVSSLGTVRSQWQRGLQNQVMLRAWTTDPQAPGYLRGGVFDQYHLGVWQAIIDRQELRATLDRDGGRAIFRIANLPSERKAGTIVPDQMLGDNLFLPLGVQQFSSFEDRLYYSEAWTVHSRSRRTAGGYGYYEPNGQPPGPTEADLLVPPAIRVRLQPIVKQVFRPGETAAESGTRVTEYLGRQCRYELDVVMPGSGDPVLAFLFETRAGHCEYFATAGVLMLRMAGVPARYVTGLVCQEQGLGGKYWLARRKDAHAWVEVWDKDRWVTVDPTPPSSRPAPAAAQTAQRWGDWLAGLWARFWALAAQGGIGAILTVIWDGLTWLLLSVPWYVWIVILAVSLGWIFRAELRGWIKPSRAPDSAWARQWRKRLEQAESQARRYGLRRPACMSVEQFIRLVQQNQTIPPHRKQAILARLLEYQAHRYARHAPDAASL